MFNNKIIAAIFICAFLINSASAYPSVFPTGVTKYDPNLADNGYTLMPSAACDKHFLIDMNGNIINTWPYERCEPVIHKPGHVICASKVNSTYFTRDIIELDWEGNDINVWSNISVHHDMELLPNGHLMAITGNYVFAPEISKYVIKDDSFLELNPEGNIVWVWHSMDHFDEYAFTDLQRQIIYEGGYYEVDGSWHNYSGVKYFDWAHHNTLSVLPVTPYQADPRFKPGNILTSMRKTNNIYIIDKETGNITWQYGMTEGIIGQHCAEMLDNGNILLFDNGGIGGYPEKYRYYSRVLEINPISKEIVWEFSGEDINDNVLSCFSPIKSGVQRLPNGNTLICEACTGRVFEVKPNKKIVWEFINPNWIGKGSGIYRAYRLPYDWAPPGTPKSEMPVIPPPNKIFRIKQCDFLPSPS